MSHTAHAGLLGANGPPIEHEGRVYRCSPLDQNAKAEYERRLTAQAMKAAAMAPAEYRSEALAAVAADSAGGAYSFYGAASQRAMNTPAGLLSLASVLFKVSADETMNLIQACPDEVRAVIDLAVLESLPEPARLRVLAERHNAKEAAKRAAEVKENAEASAGPRPT